MLNLNLFLLIFLSFNSSFITSFISISTYIDEGYDYRTRRYISHNDTLYIFHSDGVIQISNPSQNELIHYLPNFLPIFNTKRSTSDLISLPNGNIAIGGLTQNKLIEFSLDGNIIHSLDLLDKKDDSQAVSISAMQSNEFLLSYVTTDLYGKIFIYDTSSLLFNEIHTAETWKSNYYSTFDCKYIHVLSNILCIFSPNDKNIYYGIFSKYGQVGTSTQLIQSINEDTIKAVWFAVLSDSNENDDVYSDIGIVYQCEGGIFVGSVHVEVDINRQYTFNEIERSIRLNVDEDWEYQVNKIMKITENMFVLIVNQVRVMFITKELTLLGDINLSTRLNVANGVMVGHLDISSLFFIEYGKSENGENVKKLIKFNMKRCNNIYQDVQFGKISIFTIEDLFNFEAEPNVNTNALYPILLSKPQQGDIIGIKYEEDNEIEQEIQIHDYTVKVNGFRYSNYEMFPHIDIDFKYYISEYIEEGFYVPSEVCEIKLHTNLDRFSFCNKNTSIIENKTRICVPITENLNLRLDEHENQYYSMYLHYNLTKFEEYYETILTILKIFIADKTINLNKKENSTIVNINGDTYSFYFFPEKINNFHTGNSSYIQLTSQCKQTLINHYKLQPNESFYLGTFNILSHNKSSYPYTLEYILYDNAGNKMDLNLCKNSTEMNYVILSNALTGMNIEDTLEIGYDLEKEDSIDIFDLNSPFYTDICFTFNSPNERDTTTEIRRLEYYPNVTLCEENCIYIGVDFYHSMVNCQCPLKTEINLNRTSLFKEINAMLGYKKQHNVVILKCFNIFIKEMFQHDNCGFYIQIVLLFLSCGFLLYYFLISLSKIKKRIRKVSNFTKPLSLSHFSNMEKSMLNHENTIKLNSKLNSNSRTNSHHSLDLALKSFSKYNGFQSSSKISNQSKSTLFDSTIGFSSLNQSNTTLFSGTSTIKQPDKNSFSRILWHKYWKMILIHHSLIGMLYSHNKFNRVNLRYVYICGYVSLICTINGFGFSYNQIKDAYYFPQSIQSVKYALSENYRNYLLGFLVSFVIYKMMFYLVFAYQKLEHLRKKTTNKEILFQEMKKANIKVIIFFVINTCLILFNLYYCSVFCIVFPHSQTRWIICIIASILLAFIIPFLLVGILAFLGSIAKIFKLTFLKKAIRFINYK